MIRKIRLILRFMMSQPGKQAIVTCILTNISRSVDYQAMKISQLIEYNLRNIFLEKSYSNVEGNCSQTLFYKIKVKDMSRSII